jgi:cytochrome bd-type quinol oxidase subunit 1
LRKDDSIKAKTCVCISITVGLGFIGGIISYFILRKENPSRAKLFLYLGIIFGIVGILLNILIGPSISELDPGFNVNI